MYKNLVESYGYCLIHLGQHTKALELEGIYPVFSHRADFVFLMGLVYMNNAMFDQAIREFFKSHYHSRVRCRWGKQLSGLLQCRSDL